MLAPIQAGNEIICPCGCGCVIQVVDELPTRSESDSRQGIPPSMNILLLGTAIEQSVKYDFCRGRDQRNQERVLKKLLDITKKYALPDRMAYSAFNQLKRNRSGFRSEYAPIKQLLVILSKDENYMFFPKMRAIKAEYEKITTN